MKTRSLCFSGLLLFAVLACPVASSAAIVNGDFGLGLTGWTSSGNVAVDAGSMFDTPPAPASAQAALGTAAASGFQPGTVSAAASLEAFLGLPAGTLTGMGATGGSAIKQSFTADAGDRLALNWDFLTDEPQGGAAKKDAFFIVLDGIVVDGADVNSVTLGSTPSHVPLLGQTGYQFSEFGNLTAGSHTLGLGIVDAPFPDTAGASVLTVTNVALVPEPSTWTLLLAGLGLVAGFRGWMRRRSESKSF